MTTSTDDADGVQGFTAPGFEALRGALARTVALDRRGGAAL
jgi:hypothetical protein